MALFKILRGSSDGLANQALHDGYAYFTPDDGRFYIDVQLATAPTNSSIIKKSGTVNGQTIYRIEVERDAIEQAIDNLQDLTFISGNDSFSYDGSAEITIDLQADWDETDTDATTYIKNKPTIINVAITVDDNAKTMFITSPVTNGDGVSY
jgi:hypothetical protein